MHLTGGTPEIARQIKLDSESVLSALPDVKHAFVDVRQQSAAAASVAAKQNNVPGIKRIVAVASGKGGVGKSTCSVNLACALKMLGANVGLLDCDIYGPSIPLMMGASGRPQLSAADKLVPPVAHGVKLMSMGFLLEGDQPVIWRGPMIQKTIQQFISAVEWAPLDYLLVDLPPGTGDAQLSLCQMVPLDGGVIITTPQEASLGVVRKGIAMFTKVNVPILGIVENMSYFITPGGERVEIFGHGGGRAEAERAKKSRSWARCHSSPKSARAGTKAYRWWSPRPNCRPRRRSSKWPRPCGRNWDEPSPRPSPSSDGRGRNA